MVVLSVLCCSGATTTIRLRSVGVAARRSSAWWTRRAAPLSYHSSSSSNRTTTAVAKPTSPKPKNDASSTSSSQMTHGSTGRNSKAMAVLERWHRLMGVRPQYHYTPGGHSKRASHFFRVTVRIPSAVRQWMENCNGIVVFEEQIVGMGRHHRKSTAQQWAADYAVQHLERLLSLPPATSGSSLSRFLDEWEQQSSSSASATRAPSWKNLPLDPQFAEPGTRRGTIDFGFLLRPTITALDHDVEKTRALRYADAPTSGTTTRSIPSNHAALRAAKVLTLTSRHHLPRTVLHGHAVDGGVLNYVHVRSTSLGYTPHRLAAGCPINLTYPQALQWTLQQIYHHHHNNNDNNENSDDHNYHKKNTNHHHRTKTKPKTRGDPNQEPPHKEPRVSARVWQECVAALGDSSWGMAKLFVQFPPSILEQLKPLLQLWDHQPAQSRLTLDEPSSPRATHSNGNTICSSFSAQQQQLQQQLRQMRIAAFQKHQSLNPLPVDQLKCWPPPFHASSSYVTLVRGGTGSGKTTRLPLRLCLETDHQNRPVRVVVVQPRRLACQSVAERVAYEQGYPLVRPGSSRDCATSDNRRADGPVGYTVRWDACPPNVQQFDRTVEFVTPGVLLRRALAQPHQWFRHVTHLVLDEVHERSAEVDLLLSLAKQTLVRQQQQQQQPPPLGADDDNDHRLQLVLMSATLDNDNNDNDDNQWQHYFAVCGPVTTVTIPSVRQFPIQTLHLGDSYFPILPSMQRLLELESMVTSSSDPNDEYNNNTSNSTITSSSSAYDDQLLDATAELAWWLVQGGNNKQPAKPQVNLDDGGSILCFLPGMDEIRRVQQQIRQWQSYHKNHHHVDICVLHSAISTQEQARVFETSPHPRIILSTNIAETSLTIPDVKVVIDSGREKQFSIPEYLAEESGTTFVASRLATISISQASARQREGRTGRVSAGVCFRLYTRQRVEQHLEPFSKPEMLSLDLQQMVLHSLSLSNGSKEERSHPLNLLLRVPDPPPEAKLEQTLRELASQGLVNWTKERKGQPVNDVPSVFQQAQNTTRDCGQIELTPLGAAVASIPVSPRLGRLLFVGLAFRAVEPALSIAALLSVPSGFQPPSLACADSDHRTWDGCSDIALQLEAYHEFLNAEETERSKNPQKTLFDLVTRVRNQLKELLVNVLLGSKNTRESRFPSEDHWGSWNTNAHRLGAIAALISNTTPHVAHLVGGMSNFATRDIAGTAKIHPASTNFDAGHRAHWYLYHELRITKVPYLHGTTAVSPLEVALFASASVNHVQCSPSLLSMSPYGLFVVDQWVPVDVTAPSQRDTFLKLRRVLTFEILQQLAVDHRIVLSDTNYHQLVLLVLSAIEEQRLPIL